MRLGRNRLGLARPADQRSHRGCILASPLIGIVMGRFSKSFRERPIGVQMAIALFTIYGAAALFGAAGGVAEFIRSGMSHSAVGIISMGWAFAWGLTITGYVLFLWPLAYLNHSLIARAARASR